GMGIPREHIDRIFEPFYTVHSGPDSAYDGTGVGLTIARAYVEAQGGQISVSSDGSTGTTVVIFIPTA
ncbi:MAG: HAMP domain-containing histidine kinase, partial [Myxococcales bacterium]|nr:HAMP domain-containing histidine kinase [Myxococcales bacterium]